MSIIFSTNPDKRMLYLIQRLKGKKQYINNRMGGGGIGAGGENPTGGTPDDKKLSISSTDTTYDFASTKLTAGAGMRLDVVGGAGPQTLEFVNTGGTYTDEQAQDAVGGMVADTDTVDLTYTDATPELKADVKKQMSVTSDASGLKLSGDATTPGNDYHYGTGTTGTKGWYQAQIPIGGIIMWPLALFDIPTNYVLCDGRLAVIPSGSINTPDLRNQFVRGVGLGTAGGAITGVSTGSDYFQTTGDKTADFLAGKKFYVTGSTGNNGLWTVASSSYSAPTTTIYVDEDVTSSVADGLMTIAKEPGAAGGINTHAHNAHAVTQPSAHSNHANLTHTTAADANSTGGTAKAVATTHTIDAHSAHAGTAVDGHSTENNIPAYIELAFIMRIS